MFSADRTRSTEGKTPASITVNIYYRGTNGSARRFAEEMTTSGTVDAIRAERGNLRYEYFLPLTGGEPDRYLLRFFFVHRLR
ncbi:hypothetical protein [Adlercreutzia aquisgranensis]|uniref:hypothetical protein n=1 Tax=Adlercreutzia aquisgranensis TaxID=2941323 RepID=UPI00203C1A97|nr:hypothetical protein [Adlercreutzia aquisgranensis]